MFKKYQNGITLIALVITIIVLLILAGVTIAMLMGDNGLLGKAGDAKTKTEKATALEKLQIEVMGSYDESGKTNAETLISNIGKNLPEATIVREEFPLVVIIDENAYKIESNGNVKESVITDRTGINVGDYIDYKPAKNENGTPKTYSKDNLVENITGSEENKEDIKQDDLKWQVLWIYKDGSMDLIGSPTSQDIYFKDATGYNNGVNVMHEICEKLYSRLGITARSVKLEDMESWLTPDGKKAKSDYINSCVAKLSANLYIEKVNTENNTVTCKTIQSYYPNLYAEENGAGINTETVKTDGKKDTDKVTTLDKSLRPDSYKSANNLTTTQTYYNISINSTNYGEGAKALSPNSSSIYYWVASRYVNCNHLGALFGLRNASTDANSGFMFNSGTPHHSYNYRLRPVVYLGAEVQVKASETASSIDGTPHTITQYYLSSLILDIADIRT